ncbi:hypothetical protein [Streptomyces sp. WMMB 714]|uniref:hypothetical protein n=1 Tax=Streptomyces sp. WMMB 714 TaxID=1286822 RepID=UPI0005F7D781|nr:hypothetical protein [Streptomyces sp. WMMB 714]
MSLPAADELFRTTGGSAVQPSAPASQHIGNGEDPSGKAARVPSSPASDLEAANVPGESAEGAEEAAAGGDGSGEHSAAAENEDPGSTRGSAQPGADGLPAGEGDGEHSGRETTGEGKQPGGRRHTVPGQSARSQSASQNAGRVPADSQRLGAQPQPLQPAAEVRAKAQPKPKPGQGAEPRSRQTAAPRRGRGANRRPSGRERHDEKITVYVSAEELMDLEHARLVLRGEHGLAVDRGRIVREAVAVVLADLESRGEASILVRRLRGR